jgi:hypothetical protein
MLTHRRHFDKDLFAGLLDQVETAVTSAGGLRNAAEWICKNTRDPGNVNLQFSLRGHEYQRAILNDTSPYVAIRKATQIGASELSIRLALAVCAKFFGINAVYVLPSIRFSQKFSMSRVDPVIAASPRLRAITSSAVNSNELKQIGSSFLHFSGAAQNSSAISIPARALFVDEYAFCDPSIVSVFHSRLGHQLEAEKIVRYFSSPLHPHSDISQLYENGTQSEYLCYHDACGEWVIVNPVEHLTIPGYDDHITNLAYSDVQRNEVGVSRAYIRCEHCGGKITTENLSDPARRSWVSRYPGRDISSYDANPLVLAHIRTPQHLLRDLTLYKNTVKWLQYAMGHPSESASDMITHAAMESSFTVAPMLPSAGGVTGGVIGCDIGKVSHICIGKRVGDSFHVVYMETVRQAEENETGRLLVERYKQYGGMQLVVDAAPDITIPRYLQGNLPYGCIWGCYFVRGRGRTTLESWETDEEAGVVKVNRTRALDEFVEAFNRGKIRLPVGLGLETEVMQHLQRLKRVINFDAAGEEAAQWIATDPETHWFFALFYSWLAAQLVESGYSFVSSLGLGGLLGVVRMKSGISGLDLV